MKFDSMRMRLSLTYAAIALLAVLALSGVLTWTLRDYYTQRERDYLVQRARAIQLSVDPALAAGLPLKALQSQIDNLAFFAQVRVRLLDQQGQPLVDTGDPAENNIYTLLPVSAPDVVFNKALRTSGSVTALPLPSQVLSAGLSSSGPIITALSPDGNEKAWPLPQRLPLGLATAPGRESVVILSGSFGQSLVASAQPVSGTMAMVSSVPKTVVFRSFDLISQSQQAGQFSDQVFRLPLFDSAQNRLGVLELSEGPSLGGAILESVTKAALIAGLIAVLLSAAAGWWISRQVTQPLTVLMQVTRRMAEGDLTARAASEATGEFGALGQSFNQMAERIEATISTLRKFAADAAHELKTPLTALVTDLELAVEDARRAHSGTAQLENAQGQVQRLHRLMDGLLDLSRLESGSVSAGRHPVELGDLLRYASEPFATQAEQAGQLFELDLPDAPVHILGDEDQLRRALGNLLENALKFTPGGGKVCLRLRAEGDLALIEVSDNGIGIPPEDLEQVFQRFHRARNASAYAGSGLGLAIVKAVAEVHGGRAWAEAAQPQGTRIILRLPLDPDDQPD